MIGMSRPQPRFTKWFRAAGEEHRCGVRRVGSEAGTEDISTARLRPRFPLFRSRDKIKQQVRIFRGAATTDHLLKNLCGLKPKVRQWNGERVRSLPAFFMKSQTFAKLLYSGCQPSLLVP